MPENREPLSVSALNALIKDALEHNGAFQRIRVKGSISNWKEYRSGVFFDLVDERGSTLSCMIWNEAASRLSFDPHDGEEVIAFGSIMVYAKRGRYSLTVYSLEQAGLGARLLALEALKKKLAAEGLFDETRKKPIPSFPKTIGIIVGAKSAAEADLVRNINRRWPIAAIHEFPSLVQGEDAPRSLQKALLSAIEAKVDILIIARGGGSTEDLWAFNDESLARLLASCPLPSISAVGHEIDTTLVDYVSDLRVSTPTAAAEAATPDQNEIKERLIGYEADLKTGLERALDLKKKALTNLSERPFFKNPAAHYEVLLKTVASLEERLCLAARHLTQRKEDAVRVLSAKMKALDPQNTIKRGYSVLSDEKGNVITSVEHIDEGETIRTSLSDGFVYSTVKRKEKNHGRKGKEL